MSKSEWDKRDEQSAKILRESTARMKARASIRDAAKRLISCQYDADESHPSGALRCVDELAVAREYLDLEVDCENYRRQIHILDLKIESLTAVSQTAGEKTE